ncbi:TPA: hypothetical protein ACQJO1_004648 [Vibrio parahaemolyticus]
MTIQAMPVERDLEGYWCHPDLPELGEDATWDEFEAHFQAQGFSVGVVWLEDDADEELVTAYFEKGATNIASWEPSKPQDAAFCLAIYATEEGPVCLWAVHSDQADTQSA